MKLNPVLLDRIIDMAIDEDWGLAGDLTSQTIFPPEHRSSGYFLAKSEGILAGSFLIERVYRRIDGAVQVDRCLPEGTQLMPGKTFAAVSGPTASLLTGERLALNFLQRMSGIASHSHRLASKIRNLPTRIVDTRKTTPCLRMLEKYAVRVGGGANHRFGLFDAAMIKDNHIAAVGGDVCEAIDRLRKVLPHTCKVEVEVTSFDQAVAAHKGGADILLLDNMSPRAMSDVVARLKGKVLLEASGGITLETIEAVAKSGVDVISIGALTHSSPALDISFEIGECP